MGRKFIRSIVERWPVLAAFYRNMRDFLEQQDPPQKTPWGFTFVGNASMANGNFEPEETRVMRRLILDADIFVNIGANVGYYCCHALSMGKPVIAIEPNAKNLYYLVKNIKNNGWAKQAEVFPVAVSVGTDILNMWGGGTGASLIRGWAAISEDYVTQVPTLSLDRVLGRNLSGKRALILADIEGAEYMMLQGAANTLSNTPKPVWITEISLTDHQPKGIKMNPNYGDIFELYFSRGYRALTADESAREITRYTVQQVLLGIEKPSTQNFVFMA